ncbi:uncharacterized protein PAE49_011719 isoform 2-T3 [Odontesthes bonariensis]|uniref:uncharacterized protein LOC142389842 isoform X2 n=1 Tax=Odontesthes bonariensis TaxID=219752 RepID=UPI003F585341
MSSYYPRTKDLTRTRKSVTDSPPSSPSYTDKNYRHERLSRYDSSGESATEKPMGRTSSYTRRETRLAALNRQEQDSTAKDYKKMYAEALQENERLKSRLQDSKQELVNIRSQLEKITQRHDRISERSTVLESEKREKQALEKRVSDMEDDLKGIWKLHCFVRVPREHYMPELSSPETRLRHITFTNVFGATRSGWSSSLHNIFVQIHHLKPVSGGLKHSKCVHLCVSACSRTISGLNGAQVRQSEVKG